MENIEFTEIGTKNRDFLLQGLAWAADWRSAATDTSPPGDLLYIVEGWTERPGDFGVLAEDTRTGTLLGVVWLRYWQEDYHSYGYISQDIPELGIAVAPGYRGLGLGRTLLKMAQQHMLKKALTGSRLPERSRIPEQGTAGENDGYGIAASISLSVETENHVARSLYESAGFRIHEKRSGDLIMQWKPGWKLHTMKPADIPETLRLWKRCEGIVLYEDAEDSREELTRFLARNPELCLTARLDGPGQTGEGAVIAAAITGWDGRRFYVHHLGVHPGFRRLGTARAILQRILQLGAERSVRKTHLFVLDSNTDARRFYHHLGWQRRDDVLLFSAECGDPPV
ncbi:GNAT family N-acetyltransferase [Salinispira pacifica]|uniref:Acetyltransferase n=1 Tax=Salinispira pacifica TaxID=1307761 RepID=V5WD96_9SPIO|nr:GNAT family N-acetyltransferase [Salinispira pacifica]AHC13565.1 Acetyltransferase [Salinispira pacifica]